MLYTNLKGHQSVGSREEDFKGFYHIWAWKPYWSCDHDHLHKLSFHYPMEALYEIWFQSASGF